jgi:hypothetical protein
MLNIAFFLIVNTPQQPWLSRRFAHIGGVQYYGAASHTQGRWEVKAGWLRARATA